MRNQLAEDLNNILDRGRALWPDIKGARFFITGGTGFIGTWLLESFVWLNDRLNLGMSAVVLTRNAEAFAEKVPHVASHPSITLLTGDIRTFAFPEGKFSFVIHGATDASAKLNAEDPIRMFDTIVGGTRRTLDFAVQSGAKNFLFLSSGAVYGDQPPHISHWSESNFNGPDCTNAGSAYAEGKRVAELLCSLYARQYSIEAKLARCFAFVGPYLPIDSHFAIGNFIRDAMAKNTIQISGDGTPYRSYLYAADLILWLWTILLRGQTARPYNVGAGEAISIAELAALVNTTLGGSGMRIMQQAQPGALPKRYVPSAQRAETELGLTQSVTLEQAIIKTARWHGWEQHS
ncbi:dTDP-glucose 4,6-dehydratase [Sulfuriferula multivorans]|uniref:dTDP-glucose 4,6-dehydratase n=1 Tax=Sulfuriferula multivorans TaxID=1559896 RepID=A0A401J9H8_9PROT|nr:NAD-dependent epimerase/dehydratase family protein [Sulfuriferula multivorans]GBL44293.1 dTDP-glucose 4,6-dehydratase [Sulfuriferula multivorans]